VEDSPGARPGQGQLASTLRQSQPQAPLGCYCCHTHTDQTGLGLKQLSGRCCPACRSYWRRRPLPPPPMPPTHVEPCCPCCCRCPARTRLGSTSSSSLQGRAALARCAAGPGRSHPPPRPPARLSSATQRLPCPVPALLSSPFAACAPLFTCLPPVLPARPACRCGRRGARAACRRWL
jgi:hypothetical protein